MNVEFYERIWMWAATGLIVLFAATVVYTATTNAVHPPSHIETIDPTKLAESPEFSNPGVTTQPDGSVKVVVVGGMYSWNPDPIEVPANRPITFRITSADVIHGFEIAGTNANAMAIPGYVSQFTIMFNKPGEYLLGCNEYCGILHHMMAGKLIVKEASATAQLQSQEAK
jgi:cytochrome c oxidase subunit II